MSEIKLCKDCKWCKPFVRHNGSLSYETAECMSPKGRRPSLLDGELVAVDLTYCKGHRSREWGPYAVACGTSGQWFEPRGYEIAPPEPAKPWWRFW